MLYLKLIEAREVGYRLQTPVLSFALHTWLLDARYPIGYLIYREKSVGHRSITATDEEHTGKVRDIAWRAHKGAGIESSNREHILRSETTRIQVTIMNKAWEGAELNVIFAGLLTYVSGLQVEKSLPSNRCTKLRPL